MLIWVMRILYCLVCCLRVYVYYIKLLMTSSDKYITWVWLSVLQRKLGYWPPLFRFAFWEVPSFNSRVRELFTVLFSPLNGIYLIFQPWHKSNDLLTDQKSTKELLVLKNVSFTYDQHHLNFCFIHK